jgi:hypothetical protein
MRNNQKFRFSNFFCCLQGNETFYAKILTFVKASLTLEQSMIMPIDKNAIIMNEPGLFGHCS